MFFPHNRKMLKLVQSSVDVVVLVITIDKNHFYSCIVLRPINNRLMLPEFICRKYIVNSNCLEYKYCIEIIILEIQSVYIYIYIYIYILFQYKENGKENNV